MTKGLQDQMRVGYVSGINLEQREVRLRKELIKEVKHVREEFKREHKLVTKAMELIKIFPNLKVRDACYLFTEEIGKEAYIVDLVLGPPRFIPYEGMISEAYNWLYVSPFIKVKGIKIHYYEYGILISPKDPHNYNDYKYDDYGSEGWLRLQGWDDNIIKKTRSILELYLKHYRTSNWTFNYF